MELLSERVEAHTAGEHGMAANSGSGGRRSDKLRRCASTCSSSRRGEEQRAEASLLTTCIGCGVLRSTAALRTSSRTGGGVVCHGIVRAWH